jgi:hypothetical protein
MKSSKLKRLFNIQEFNFLKQSTSSLYKSMMNCTKVSIHILEKKGSKSYMYILEVL